MVLMAFKVVDGGGVVAGTLNLTLSRSLTLTLAFVLTLASTLTLASSFRRTRIQPSNLHEPKLVLQRGADAAHGDRIHDLMSMMPRCYKALSVAIHRMLSRTTHPMVHARQKDWDCPYM